MSSRMLFQGRIRLWQLGEEKCVFSRKVKTDIGLVRDGMLVEVQL